MNFQVLTVSQLNTYIKSIIDGDINLNNVFIEGEISNFKNHYASGHLYFSLKDEESVIKCVMFNRAATRLKFIPENSMQVICCGKISVYPRDGQYQLYAEDMQPTGIGALALAYEQLKKKLEAEGLFNPQNKRPMPQNPKRVAVLTSETGAAIQDIISVITRRNPNVEIVMCPVVVQGESAPKSMICMLDQVYSVSGIDLIIIGRGGGSYEDLFCFNDEALVRKIYESPIPVISAVGHETDFTLCDLVSDMRAPTPSVAAEIAVPDLSEVLEKLKYTMRRIQELVYQCINFQFERYDRCISCRVFEDPKEIISNKFDNFLQLFARFKSSADASYMSVESRFKNLLTALEALNPISTMARGYSAVSHNGKIIRESSDLKTGDNVNIRFFKGGAKCTVIELEGENHND